jgi:ABC-type Fe3+/spermidine/putrescine transport system ATPase subunit
LPISDVSLTSVSKRFDATLAVDDMTLEVPAGQFVTFLGPSGCGKSTTLRLIGGFERPDTGTIAIRDRPVNDLPPHRRDTAMVFQDYALFPHLPVADNVAFGLVERGVPKRETASRVAAILDLVALSGAQDARVQELSGGQQQRVALARALVLNPAVLLLDEPLGALDLSLRRLMQGELRRMQRETGTTFLYVTHDQHEALTMSDRVVVMNGGRIEQTGSPADIFERPATRFVATFMGARNVLDAVVSGSTGASIILRAGGNTIALPELDQRRDGAIVLVIRPERIQLETRSDENGRCGRWPGVVRDQTYTGSSLVYEITLTDGTSLVAEVPARERSPRFSPGDPIDALIDPADIVLIAP